MTNKNLKSKEYYLNLPWVFEFSYTPEDKIYSARVKGLMCSSGGKTMEEAIQNIKEALELYIECMLEEGKEPLPINEDEATGKAQIRMSKKTHLKLLQLSKEEGVSVSHLINDAIVKQYG